jgi:Copper amine oxidase N-terminal domain/Steryl acetyl hydrolase
MKITSKFTFVLLLSCVMIGCHEKELITDITYPSGQEPQNASISLAPRILINGEILGYQDTDYKDAYWQGSNLMVDAAYWMKRLKYQILWDVNTNTWMANRLSTNQAGKETVELTIGSALAKVGTLSYKLPVVPTLKQGKVFAPVHILAELGGCSIMAWDKDTHSFQTYFYEELDMGLYFYGKQINNDDAVGTQKYVSGQNNLFFDPNKPTLIYTHGWQLDGVKNKEREDFSLKNEEISIQTQNFWIDKGWNIAIFHWVQLADDGGVPPPREAEAKIYDIHNSLAGMRWKRSNGVSVTQMSALPQKNVSELYADAYQAVFGQNFSGNEIRLVGNSLGGNLTMAMLMQLHQRGIHYLPQRVTLIDPYWSPNLGIGQVTFPYSATSAYDLATTSATIQRDNYGIAIEYIRSSIAGATGTSVGTVGVTAFSHFGTDYSWNVINKHTVPVRQYLWSIAFNPPQEVSRPDVFSPFSPTGGVAGSAATSHARIKEMMRNDKYWNHVQGRATLTPEDDVFELREGLY